MGQLAINLADYALFWPGVAVALVAGSVLAAPLARAMHRPWAVAFSLFMSVGVIVAATLTPGRDALLFGIPGTGDCDVSTVALPTIAQLRFLNDTSLNVLLFVPLGLALPLTGGRRRVLMLLGAAVVFPIAIEVIQLVVTPLGRSCQGVDVVDNLTGLAIGLATATLLVGLTRLATDPSPPD